MVSDQQEITVASRRHSRNEFSDGIRMSRAKDDDFGNVGQAQAFQCPSKQRHAKHG